MGVLYMERDTDTISASEINRYTYCPYQWFYERVYGRKELSRLMQQKKEKKKKTTKTQPPKSTAMSNFARGRQYHKEEYARFCKKQQVQKMVWRVVMICVVLILIVLFIRMR